MSRVTDRKLRRVRIKRRYRHLVRGTKSRPRLAVYRSLRHVYAQIIDDEHEVTLVSASTLEKDVAGGKKNAGSREFAETIGKLIADRAKSQGIESVVFDRGGFQYHGVIRAIADAARDAGLKF